MIKQVPLAALIFTEGQKDGEVGVPGGSHQI
jgi:hypothetical protein